MAADLHQKLIAETKQQMFSKDENIMSKSQHTQGGILSLKDSQNMGQFATDFHLQEQRTKNLFNTFHDENKQNTPKIQLGLNISEDLINEQTQKNKFEAQEDLFKQPLNNSPQKTTLYSNKANILTEKPLVKLNNSEIDSSKRLELLQQKDLPQQKDCYSSKSLRLEEKKRSSSSEEGFVKIYKDSGKNEY